MLKSCIKNSIQIPSFHNFYSIYLNEIDNGLSINRNVWKNSNVSIIIGSYCVSKVFKNSINCIPKFNANSYRVFDHSNE